MDIIRDPYEFKKACRSWHSCGLSTALTPTMGFLHDGHLSLMDEAERLADISLASIFVNPAQFGPGEDLDRYPRAFERDCELAEAHGVDLLFAPEPDAMYRKDHATWVEVPELARGLCGASRPTHFRGVCTVVAKLLHLAEPDYAVFGQKDWQQLAIIRRMVRDLDFGVQVVGMPIVREPDGLAMSSRNVNLTPDERAQAPQIHAGLRKLQQLADMGERDGAALLAALREHYARHLPAAEVDYLELVHPESLEPVAGVEETALAAVALRMSRARLIDNSLVRV